MKFILPLLTVFFCSPLCANPEMKLADRVNILEALSKQDKIQLSQTKKLIHLCNLCIKNQAFPVIEVYELIKGEVTVTRGNSKVFILDSSLKFLQEVSFNSAEASPLYCHKNQLFWGGVTLIDNLLPEGNVFTFKAADMKPVVSYVETNNFPDLKYLQ